MYKGLYGDNGKEHRNYYNGSALGLRVGVIIYRDNGKKMETMILYRGYIGGINGFHRG